MPRPTLFPRIRHRLAQDAERAVVGLFTSGFVEAVCAYLRVEVEGMEHVPRRGRAIIAPNHSGCAGYDAVIVAHVVARELKRVPRILTVWHLFEKFPWLAKAARRLGSIEASTSSGLEALHRNRLLLIFPEGEEGSFKPSSEAYQLQKFHGGFVRMAVLTGAPIVPCVVIGAEETHINLGTLRFGRRGRFLWPVPFNVLPLPAKWKIRFLEPILPLDYTPQELSDLVRDRIQTALGEERAKRTFVYFGRP